MSECVVRNAKITATKLGREDHGIFTFELFVEIGDTQGCCAIGGYSLDWTSPSDHKTRIYNQYGLELLSKVMDVVGVKNWEDLKGKYIRVLDEGWGKTITTIGNLMNDKWLNFKHFFEERKKEE